MRADHVVRVLGPVDLLTPDGPRSVGGPRQRALLAALVLSVGHAIPTDHLIEVLWGEEPPPSALGALQSYVSRLRCLIGADGIVRRNHAYMLVAAAESIDALRFEEVVTLALDNRPDPARCRELCQEALALWRGVPFGDLADEFPFRLEAIRLDEIRHATMELRFEADLALGHHDLVVGAIEAAVEEYPHRERLRYLLIEALTNQERRFDALQACREFREMLDTVGMQPANRLTAIEDDLHAG